MWVAEKLGYDVRQFSNEELVQKWLLAATGGILVLLGWVILRVYLSPGVSWILTVVLVWGSELGSTFGSALWNLNITVLLIMAVVWLLARHHAGKATTVSPVLLGFLLSLAFICRPTAAVFVVVTFLYLLIWNRRELWPAAGAALLGLIAFILYNQAVMGLPLPPYYLPQRLESRTPFVRALWGLLFSPSRGLFVFSPIILYILVLVLIRFKTSKQQSRHIVGLLLLWFAIHLFVIARFDHWWGGSSYGSRLLTDLMPAAVWLTAVVWPRQPVTHNRSQSILFNSVFILLAVFSIYSHLYTGLFNPAAQAWSGGALSPNIDRSPQYLFDWRYPQFLATETQLCQRHGDFLDQLHTSKGYFLSAYPSEHTLLAQEGTVLTTFGSLPSWMKSEHVEIQQADTVSFQYHTYLPIIFAVSPIYFLPKGWYSPVGSRMKSACVPTALVIGSIDDTLVAQPWQGNIVLGTETEQSVQVLVNEQPLIRLDLQESQRNYVFTIPANTFSSTEQNQIQIIPSNDENRTDMRAWNAPPIYFYSLTLTAVP